MSQGPLSLCILRLLSLKSNQQVFAFWSICKSKCLMKKIWQNAFLVVEVTVLQNAPGCLSQEVDIIWGWRCHYDNLPSIDFIWIFMITSCPIPRVSSTSWEKVKRISSTFVYGNPMSDIYFMIFPQHQLKRPVPLQIYLVTEMKFSHERDKSERVREALNRKYRKNGEFCPFHSLFKGHYEWWDCFSQLPEM